MKIRKPIRIILSLVLSLGLALMFSGPVLASEDELLSEVRGLLMEYYVDPLSEEVLNASTIQEMLTKLGDENTEYLTGSEFEAFLDGLDRTFSGIGVELQMAPQGALVTKILAGYGAEKAGLKAGDIIIEADGFSLVDKSLEFCVSKLKGPEGSKANLKIVRGAETLSFAVVRQQIVLPLVEGRILENRIGYLAIYSFGEETPAQFQRQFEKLKAQGANSWIIDLRGNGGGYTQAAFELLGYLIGNKTAVIVKDNGDVYTAIQAKKQDQELEGPIILLTDSFTGSASEIVAGAVKDHNRATLLGKTTYGSGRVKALVPLSNGDYLKMTIQRFFSPGNKAIDQVGVSPHLNLVSAEGLELAALLLKNSNTKIEDKTGYLKLKAGPNDFILSLADLRQEKNWQAGQRLFDIVRSADLKLGTEEGWSSVSEEFLKERENIYYPGYSKVGNLTQVPLNKMFTITFNCYIDYETINGESIELIQLNTGERLPCTFTAVDRFRLKAKPQKELQAQTDYWLVIHPEVKSADGRHIRGGVARIQTLGS
ncbi:MAG: S41 family peptidase [Desulfitobacteriia bacterium]